MPVPLTALARPLLWLLFSLTLYGQPSAAQQLALPPAQLPSLPDSLHRQEWGNKRPATDLRGSRGRVASAKMPQLLLPAVLIGAGALTTENVRLINSDAALREESREHLPVIRTNMDNQLRHLPAYTALGLSVLGVKGRHGTVHQALLFALTYTINNTLTSNLKRLTAVERPGGTSFDSFPSQHTSAAFSAARFLDKEYGDRSGWYRVGGYSVATGVAALRVVKDNHWLSDVVAGAGVGMLSTELAYWAYPVLERYLVPPRLRDRLLLVPQYTNGAVGGSLVLVL